MKDLVKFEINGSIWEIRDTDYLPNNSLGNTNYGTNEINLLKGLKSKIRTLKHELAHCYMWEYGLSQEQNTTYGYEEICDIVSASNDFINKVVEKYIKEKRMKR